MTNGLSEGGQRIRSLTTRGMVVPLKFTLGTSAAIVKAVPLLLVDLLNEDGVTGRAYTFCYRPSGASGLEVFALFHQALTREAARSRPARLKWSHLLNTSATTLRRYSLNILKELGKV